MPSCSLGRGLAVLLATLLAALAARLGRRKKPRRRRRAGSRRRLAGALVARKYLPLEVPDAVNNRPRTDDLGAGSEAAARSVIHVPATFPAEDLDEGPCSQGLGVPDMRGRIGTPSFYTSDPAFRPGDNAFSLELVHLPARRGRIETFVVGPQNKPFFDYVVERRLAGVEPARRADARRGIVRELEDAGVPRRFDLPLVLERRRQHGVSAGGRSETLEVGQWSDCFVPTSTSIRREPPRSAARHRTLQAAGAQPEIKLYTLAAQFPSRLHPVAFSAPEYSEELRPAVRALQTLGWAVDSGRSLGSWGDEQLFLEDMKFTDDKFEEMTEGLLARRRRSVRQIFYFTDRIAHLFWRFLVAPSAARPATAAKWQARCWPPQEYGRARGQGAAPGGADARSSLLRSRLTFVRRGVNYTTGSSRNGLMALKNQPLAPRGRWKAVDTRELFGNVDWSRTKAYAMGRVKRCT